MQVAGFEVGNTQPLFLIAGPCVIESDELIIEVAGTLKELTAQLGVPYVFKASFDKANRTSIESKRGPGLEAGLRSLERVKKEVGVPILTDVHESTPIDEVAAVVDILQTPAFLVRQTDFIQRVAKAGTPVNIKKGQFLAPWDMQHVVDKCAAAGNEHIMLCERGVSFGYGALISDMRGIPIMRKTGKPVVFDATHSVQQPSAGTGVTGGQREMIPVLARSAVAAGIAGLFMETHPKPEEAWSDGPNQWPLRRMKELLTTLTELDSVVKSRPFLEDGE